MFEYKVVEQKHKSLIKGRIRAKDFEDLLNKHPADGWVLGRIISGETFSFLTGGKDVYLVIFRREQ